MLTHPRANERSIGPAGGPGAPALAQRRARRRRRRVAAGVSGARAHRRDAAQLHPGRTTGPGAQRAAAARVRRAPRRPAIVRRAPIKPTYGVAPPPRPSRCSFKKPFHVASAILFDVWTGRVLWAQNPGAPAANRQPDQDDDRAARGHRQLGPRDQVMITRDAVHFSGSGVGLLPLGKHVRAGRCSTGCCCPRATTRRSPWPSTWRAPRATSWRS